MSDDDGTPAEATPTAGRGARLRAGLARAGRRARELDHSPGLRTAVQRLRRALPGDAHFGDPLSLGGARYAEFAGRAVVELTGDRPGVTREIGLGGVQLWQAVLERFGSGTGDHEVTLVFTDLVEFSRWALRAGDDEVSRVLRLVAGAWEKPVTERGGRVVKRLGDGLMAAFAQPGDALDAVVAMQQRLAGVAVDGWTPRMRAGAHRGCPRRVGGDYLGVTVNTAARLGDLADADEILVSGEVLEHLDDASWLAKRRRRTPSSARALKGVPDDLQVFAVRPR